MFLRIEQECCLPPEKYLDLSTYEIFYDSGIYQKQVSHVSCIYVLKSYIYNDCLRIFIFLEFGLLLVSFGYIQGGRFRRLPFEYT